MASRVSAMAAPLVPSAESRRSSPSNSALTALEITLPAAYATPESLRPCHCGPVSAGVEISPSSLGLD
jgi:hypothetical protein